MKPVAVIILNWNGREMLRQYLPSVLEHTPAELADVIVADNGSTDGSLEMLAAEFSGVQVLDLKDNHGFSGGYNRALSMVSHPYAVLLNSDVMVDSDWLTPLYEYMEAHPGTAACQPKMLSLKEPEMFEYAGAAGGFLDRHGYPYCRGRIFGTCERDNGQYDTPLEVDWASGAALMVRRGLYLEAGGLDESFFAHMEEIDLCWRLRRMGHSIAAVPQARVYHLGGGSLPPSDPRKTYLNFRNNLLMMHKNIPARYRSRELFVRRVLDGVAWLRAVMMLEPRNAAAIVRAHRDYARMRRDLAMMPESPDAPNPLAGRPDILTSYWLRGRRTFEALGVS